eukprot:RCo049351
MLHSVASQPPPLFSPGLPHPPPSSDDRNPPTLLAFSTPWPGQPLEEVVARDAVMGGDRGETLAFVMPPPTPPGTEPSSSVFFFSVTPSNHLFLCLSLVRQLLPHPTRPPVYASAVTASVPLCVVSFLQKK